MYMHNPEPTINDLMSTLNTGRPRGPRDVDVSTLRYALYAHKSTRGDELGLGCGYRDSNPSSPLARRASGLSSS